MLGYVLFDIMTYVQGVLKGFNEQETRDLLLMSKFINGLLLLKILYNLGTFYYFSIWTILRE